MANIYKVVDEKCWGRAIHCMIFRNSIEPTSRTTFEVDITSFLQKIKRQNFSFTFTMIYVVCKCANEIEAFRYRSSDGTIVLYDKIDTAFTYLNQDTQLLKMVNIPMQNKIEKYVGLAAKAAKEQKEYFTGSLGNNVSQCSPTPWITYTHISHINSGRKDNATPLFNWRKYYKKNRTFFIPISVQAHHSFVDGIHIGEFAGGLQKYMDEY